MVKKTVDHSYIETIRRELWRKFFVAAIRGGSSSPSAIASADHGLKAYEERFMFEVKDGD